MWRIIIFGLLFMSSAVLASDQKDENVQVVKDKDETEATPSLPIVSEVAPETGSSPSLEPLTEEIASPAPLVPSTPVTIEEAEVPTAPSPPAPGPIPVQEPEEPPRRRIVTYDQRQEGQYNIRADLENFMIVLIPPNPTEGVNLLELLAQSSLKRSNLNKPQKKHQVPGKYRPSLKNNHQSFNFANRQPSLSLMENPTARISEFIEGRTPYRVDISSSEGDSNRLQPDRQVDVLPPPYPLSYHLMKPYHLEAEPTVIQALPPPPSGGKFLDDYNRFPEGDAVNNNYGNNYFRLAKSIQDQRPTLHFNRRRDIPAHGDDMALLYSSLDGLRNVDGFDDIRSRTMDLDLTADTDTVNYNANDVNPGNSWELKLIGASEECGPDRKRDSYGICRFVEDY